MLAARRRVNMVVGGTMPAPPPRVLGRKRRGALAVWASRRNPPVPGMGAQAGLYAKSRPGSDSRRAPGPGRRSRLVDGGAGARRRNGWGRARIRPRPALTTDGAPAMIGLAP